MTDDERQPMRMSSDAEGWRWGEEGHPGLEKLGAVFMRPYIQCTESCQQESFGKELHTVESALA